MYGLTIGRGEYREQEMGWGSGFLGKLSNLLIYSSLVTSETYRLELYAFFHFILSP